MGVETEFFEALERGISTAGGLRALASAAGVQPSTISRWRSGEHFPTFAESSKVCNLLGLHLVSEDVLRDMSVTEDFISVPIVDPYRELLPGFIPEEQIVGWCRIDRRYYSVQGRRKDLCVVEVMDDSSNTIKDGSLVLVDRSDRAIVNHMLYLVRQYGVMGIRRIFLANDGQLVIWRNLKDGTATAYSLEEAEEAIVGRAGWIRGSIEDGKQLILDGRV